jgi:hypothetical protein
MSEKVVVFQESNFESFAKLAESIINETAAAHPTEVVAVRSRWGGSQLKVKLVSASAESAALAKYTKLRHM